MYEAHDDPYLYPKTDVLKNLADLKDSNSLSAFELHMVGLRYDEPIPSGSFDCLHYKNVHHHIFQDIYAWAGDYRTIRIAKGGDWFCYPEHIESQMAQLFDKLKSDKFLQNLSSEMFVKQAAKFLSGLNAIHPFRDGNGRAQITFLTILAESAKHPINVEAIAPSSFLHAMIRSFKGDNKPLEIEIENLLA